ncbi:MULTISPECIES: hypothetical protein [Gordonia]|uniref:hypothetical protein n=1 Tax=Gordonia TaxID=2053 RepID=UPI000AD74B87|nr:MULTISPECIES: hypothetical protein [Gordonia]WFN94168.1 hypothetical protein P5P27_06375 [Gordonia sihwensis]WFN94229.1 hypothetical protein P5P27_06685 [Gordonia sihwensis]
MMDEFYGQRVSILRPAKISGRYGGDERLSYDLDDGATLTEVPFGVDMQPRTELELGADEGRVSIQIGYELHTPPGHDLDLTATDRIVYAGRHLDVDGDVHRWPSVEYPGGVDHVEVALTFYAG